MAEELAQWKLKLQEQWKDSSIEELLDEVLHLAYGDDYDGCFSQHGWEEYQFMVSLLKERIAAQERKLQAAIAWLNENEH